MSTVESLTLCPVDGLNILHASQKALCHVVPIHREAEAQFGAAPRGACPGLLSVTGVRFPVADWHATAGIQCTAGKC